MTPISIPKILGQSWAWSRDNLNIFIGVALAIHTFPSIILASITGPLTADNFSWEAFVAIILTGLVTGVLAQALIFARMRLDLFGPDPEGRRPWGLAFHYLIPILLIGFATSALIALGFVALIIPGIYLAVIWAVATPALLVEGLSIENAFRRSAELTKGHRWHVLGFYLIAIVIGMTVNAFWTAIATALAGGELADAGIWADIITQSIAGLFATFFTIAQMILYRNLRQSQTGLGDHENSIFD